MRKGTIVAYSEDVSGGIIQTEDQEPHYFSFAHWLPKDVRPSHHAKVTFDITAGGVRNVKIAE